MDRKISLARLRRIVADANAASDASRELSQRVRDARADWRLARNNLERYLVHVGAPVRLEQEEGRSPADCRDKQERRYREELKAANDIVRELEAWLDDAVERAAYLRALKDSALEYAGKRITVPAILREEY